MVKFEDRYKTFGHFMRYNLQEISTQAPILITIAAPGGISMLAGYGAGEQLTQMYKNDFRVREIKDQLDKGIIDKNRYDEIVKDENLKGITSKWNKALAASGYAAAEIIPEYLVTKPLMMGKFLARPSVRSKIYGTSFAGRLKLVKSDLPQYGITIPASIIAEKYSEVGTTMAQNLIND